MSVTPFSLSNQEYSNRAHFAAQKLIYPKAFNTNFCNLSFETTSLEKEKPDSLNSILDGKMGIDRIVSVSFKGGRFPINFTVQERFRRPGFSKYRDITITEFNRKSRSPGELYKITSDYFVYGYFDPSGKHFLEHIVVNVANLKKGIVDGSLVCSKGFNERSSQDFWCIKIDALLQDSYCVNHGKKNHLTQ